MNKARWEHLTFGQQGAVAFSSGYVGLEEIYKVLIRCPRLGDMLNSIMESAGLIFEAGNFWLVSGQSVYAWAAWERLFHAATGRRNAVVGPMSLTVSLAGVCARIRRTKHVWRLTIIILKRSEIENEYGVLMAPACASSVGKYLLAETSLELKSGYISACEEPELLDPFGDIVTMGKTIMWASSNVRITSFPKTVKTRLREHPGDKVEDLRTFGTFRNQVKP